VFSYDLLLNAVTAGLLLGGFYAAVTVGVSISFGILDIVNIAHPSFIILGSYIAYIANARLGIDPILAGIVALPAFYGSADLSGVPPVVRATRRGPAARPGVIPILAKHI
jgi:branched-subunit amino acid ABC-type transport system permease component